MPQTGATTVEFRKEAYDPICPTCSILNVNNDNNINIKMQLVASCEPGRTQAVNSKMNFVT